MANRVMDRFPAKPAAGAAVGLGTKGRGMHRKHAVVSGTPEGSPVATLVSSLFDECQRSFATHKKAIKTAKRLLADDPRGFRSAFLDNVNRILPVFKKEPATERVLQFVVKVAVATQSFAGSEDFASSFMKYLLDVSDVKDKAVRFRCCQLISGIMNSMDEEAEIDGELWELVLEKLLPRTVDKLPTIRAVAVSALSRLQNPLEPEDDVMKRYVHLLATDSNKDVRKTVLSNIGLSRHSLPHVLKRTRDSSAEVRKHAFQVLQNKLNVRSLSIEQRVSLLRTGILDRDEGVKGACEEMLRGWFLAQSLGDDIDDDNGFPKKQQQAEGPVRFLGCLDVEDFEDEAQMAMWYIYQAGLVDNSIPEPLEENYCATTASADTIRPWYHVDALKQDPSPERTLGWRLLCKYLSEKKDHNRLERVLPDLSRFCELLNETLSNAPEQEFVARQLLGIALYYDFSDEAGRRTLSATLRGLLAGMSTPETTVDSIMRALSRVHSDENEFIRIILEIISDVQDPLEELQSASMIAAREQVEQRYEELVLQLESLEARKKQCQKRKDAAGLRSVQQEIDELEEEALSLEKHETALQDKEVAISRRCLAITHSLLQHTRKDLKDAGIAGLLHSVIYPSFQSAEISIRNAAVRCFGLYALLDEAMAKTHMFIFLEAMANDVEEIKQSAMEALFDFLLYFRWIPDDLQDVDISSLLNRNEESCLGEETEEKFTTLFQKLICTLIGFLKEGTAALKTAAAEGFAKLFLAECYFNQDVLTELVLEFFASQDGEDHKLKQMLSVFLPAYAFSSPEHQRNLCNTFVPATRAIFNAMHAADHRGGRKDEMGPASRSAINPINVAQFLLYLTDKDNLHPGTHKTKTLNQNPTSEGGILTEHDDPHLLLAVSILGEILANPKGAEGKYLPKALGMLHFNSRESSRSVISLQRMHGMALAAVSDRNAKHYLEKFGKVLSSGENPYDESSSLGGEELAKLECLIQKIKEDWENARGIRKTAKRSGKRKVASRVTRYSQENYEEEEEGIEADEWEADQERHRIRKKQEKAVPLQKDRYTRSDSDDTESDEQDEDCSSAHGAIASGRGMQNRHSSRNEDQRQTPHRREEATTADAPSCKRQQGPAQHRNVAAGKENEKRGKEEKAEQNDRNKDNRPKKQASAVNERNKKPTTAAQPQARNDNKAKQTPRTAEAKASLRKRIEEEIDDLIDSSEEAENNEEPADRSGPNENKHAAVPARRTAKNNKHMHSKLSPTQKEIAHRGVLREIDNLLSDSDEGL